MRTMRTTSAGPRRLRFAPTPTPKEEEDADGAAPVVGGIGGAEAAPFLALRGGRRAPDGVVAPSTSARRPMTPPMPGYYGSMMGRRRGADDGPGRERAVAAEVDDNDDDDDDDEEEQRRAADRQNRGGLGLYDRSMYRDALPERGGGGTHRGLAVLFLFLLLVAFLLSAAASASRRGKKGGARKPLWGPASFVLAPSLGLGGREGAVAAAAAAAPDLVHASDVLDVSEDGSSVSFSELARRMIPRWYAAAVAQLPIFTPDVRPNGVYKSRKIMLKTRDLIDAFGPAYPNDTRYDGGDLWRSVRRQLMRGYEKVGDFQDLHNCHVMYTQEQLEERRDDVLRWREEFEAFRTEHDVPAFLSAPAVGSYYHKKESHLFWQYAPFRPRGSDPATPSLRLLGVTQLANVLTYLRTARPYASVLDERAHAPFHNLRKELRSLTDEHELLGYAMFNGDVADETDRANRVLKRARKLLGDLNDDWVAYDVYVATDVFPDEQVRLAKKIDDDWADFKRWTYDVDFERLAIFLAQSMGAPTNFGRLSLNEFLLESGVRPTSRIVIGNRAGDADTIVSAVVLAYIESVAGGGTPKTPVVPIPRADLETQRPDVRLLLDLAGVDDAARDALIFVDDPVIAGNELGKDVDITLVDHNVLSDMFRARGWTVSEIVDHHHDAGLDLDTCSGADRTVAFANGKATVASACTLVAERLEELWGSNEPYPTTVGALLLGVILLDSVNLSPEVGKVTQRDRDAVRMLVERTEWSSLPVESREALQITSGGGPNTSAFFRSLQGAKYDPRFWTALSARDALRYDYKDYSYSKEGGGEKKFGVSSVLAPLEDFLEKPRVAEEIVRYMSDVGSPRFLGIMFAFQEDGHLHRQLVLCGTGTFPLDDLAAFASRPEYKLDLEEIHPPGAPPRDDYPSLGLSMRFFVQRNVKPSRKQIAPMLLDFFRAVGVGDAKTHTSM